MFTLNCAEHVAGPRHRSRRISRIFERLAINRGGLSLIETYGGLHNYRDAIEG